MIFTSKIGRFEFDDHESISLCKVIRDSVIGQWLNPKPGTQRLVTTEDIKEFIRDHSSALVKAIWFDFMFPDEEHKPDPALEELPQPPLIPVPPIWIRQALVGDARPDWMGGPSPSSAI